MRSLIALENFDYAGKSLRAGDAFDALTESDALVLKGAGKAKLAPSVETRALENSCDAPQVKGRRYSRRDMRPED